MDFQYRISFSFLSDYKAEFSNNTKGTGLSISTHVFNNHPEIRNELESYGFGTNFLTFQIVK